MRTAEQIVNAEIHACVSYLVATLAGANYSEEDSEALASLKDQAMELAAPIDDWEEPLLENGWSRIDKGDGQVSDWRWVHMEDIGPIGLVDAQSACEEAGLDPYQREVSEHWIVSDWLADQLEAHGEKVDRDFAGLTVWARTTTGQAIYADHLFEEIAAEMNARYPG